MERIDKRDKRNITPFKRTLTIFSRKKTSNDSLWKTFLPSIITPAPKRDCSVRDEPPYIHTYIYIYTYYIAFSAIRERKDLGNLSPPPREHEVLPYLVRISGWNWAESPQYCSRSVKTVGIYLKIIFAAANPGDFCVKFETKTWKGIWGGRWRYRSSAGTVS